VDFSHATLRPYFKGSSQFCTAVGLSHKAIGHYTYLIQESVSASFEVLTSWNGMERLSMCTGAYSSSLAKIIVYCSGHRFGYINSVNISPHAINRSVGQYFELWKSFSCGILGSHGPSIPWFSILLAQACLLVEVLNHTPTRERQSRDLCPFTVDGLLEPLRKVKETQRLHSPSFQAAHVTNEDLVLPGGYMLSKYSMIMTSCPVCKRMTRVRIIFTQDFATS
jgi:hypothetical protein